MELRGSPCRNDSQQSSWLLSPETRHTIWISSQCQTQIQNMVWIILHRIFRSWQRQQWEPVQVTVQYPGWNRKVWMTSPTPPSSITPSLKVTNPLPDFWLDKSRLPITNFLTSLIFDDSLTCGLLRNKKDPIHEPFLSGSRVYIQHNHALDQGTNNKIPFPVSPILKCDVSPSPK